MIKALLKKQILEAFSVFTVGKNGKRRSPAAIVGFVLLMVYAFGVIGFMFWEIADMLCEPLVHAGRSWVYFAFMGTVATGFGIVGGIFSAKVKLYEAKDNDLLLSMPVPSWAILFSRIAGLYLLIFLFEGLVFVPTILRYSCVGSAGFSFPSFLCSLAALFIMPLGALAVCLLLGWLIAFVSSKLPVKNLVEVIFSIGFLVAYFALYSKLNEYMGYVVSHGEAVGRVMKTALYPFSQLGLACTGKGVSLLLYALIFGGAFALVYLLLSATYLRLATAKRGSVKAKYTGKGHKGRSVFVALLNKESRRYFSNSMVALNCFLGSVFLVLLPFLSLFERSMLQELTALFGGDLSLLLAVIVCALGSANMIAGASVSLEGDSLDILRVMPVKTEKVLFVKAAFHFLTTGIPAFFSTVFLCILCKLGILLSSAVTLTVLLFIAVGATGGLTVNLLFPNLKWTNELTAVKQSVSSLMTMLGGWGIVALFVGGYFLFGKYLPVWGYLLVCAAVLALVCGAFAIWLKKKGVRIFEGL